MPSEQSVVMPDREPAYSYIRFSSEKQKGNDSLRRQLANSTNYAEAKNLHLVTDYRDLAVSAWKGEHRATGALGQFLAAVQSGRIPSHSHLLVESLDRLSREKPLDALQAFIAMLTSGLTIHTLMDRQVYTYATVNGNPMLLFGSIMIMVRSHEEGDTKSVRVTARKTQNYLKACDTGQVMTAQCPAWLRVATSDKGRQFVIIPERAEIIRRIFQWTIDGLGAEMIVRRLNEAGVRSFADPAAGKTENGWHKFYVRSILTRRAVCGEYTPASTTKGRQPMAGYYPRIIDEEVWERARAAREGRTRMGGSKERGWNNLFAGFSYCAECGGSLSVRGKGVALPKGKRETRYYFVCENFKRARGCTNRTNLDYAPVERAILDQIWQVAIDPDDVFGQGDQIRIADNERADLKAKAEHYQARIEAFMMGDEPVTASMRSVIVKMETAKAAALQRYQVVSEQVARMRAKTPTRDHLNAIKLLRDEAMDGDVEVRARLNQGLREVVDCLVMTNTRQVVLLMSRGKSGFQVSAGEVVRHWDMLMARPQPWEAWLAKWDEMTRCRKRGAGKLSDRMRQLPWEVHDDMRKPYRKNCARSEWPTLPGD